MQRTISAMVGKGSVNHNSRKFRAENVDGTRTHLNIDYCNENIKTVYHELFDEALERYNAKQIRSDRKIKDYYEKIRSSKQEKPFHEIILQVGLGHLNGFKRFGKRTDLVDLDEDGVRNPLFNAFLKDGGIRHEEVVTHELDALAESGRELGPAFPVAFSHAVFDRDDRVLVDPVLENSDPFLGREGLARGLLHDVLAVFEEFARGAVETDHDVLACFKAGSLDGFEDELDGFFMAFALGGEAALVTDGRGHAAGVDDLLEGMERLGTVAKGFTEGRSAHRNDHELLQVEVVVGVSTAVDDVHHRDGHLEGTHAAEVAVERHAGLFGGGAGDEVCGFIG